MMNERKINKHTIDFSPEDEHEHIKNMFIKLIVERDHPEVIEKAEELAREFIESESTDK